MPGVMEMSTDALAYEALLRVFRNAIVDHVRKCLVGAYGDGAVPQVRRPFTDDEWGAALQSAESARSLGYVTREHLDDFDYLGVNHFYNIFELHFTILVPEEQLPPSELQGKFKQQFLSWLREIKGFRDPLAHPAADEMSPVDAARVVDSARRVLMSIGLVERAEEVNSAYTLLIERAARASAPDPLEGEIEDTLPPAETIVVDFVGRQPELASLWNWVLGTNSNRWMLSGDGGKGKSAIAYSFASDVRRMRPEGLVGVYWLSSSAGGSRKVSQSTFGTPNSLT
jgi:hypothetical protein